MDIRGSAVVVVGLMLIFILLNLYIEAVSCQYSVFLPERNYNLKLSLSSKQTFLEGNMNNYHLNLRTFISVSTVD